LSGEGFTIRTKYFSCPHCGERISVVLDLSAGPQRYIEDCEVCCNPITISFQAEDGIIVFFEAATT